MAASWSLHSIFHFTVAAKDFERSLEFYRTLGFRLLRDNRDVVWPDIVALRTQGVRAAWRELSARGIAFITEPRGPDPDTGIEAVVCCRDPDGLILELIEYMPGVLGSRIDKLARRDGEGR